MQNKSHLKIFSPQQDFLRVYSCVEKGNIKTLKWLPDLKSITSCQHNTFGGAPSVFDFFDLPIKQRGERLVDAKVYKSVLSGLAHHCNFGIFHLSPGCVGCRDTWQESCDGEAVCWRGGGEAKNTGARQRQ